MEEQFFSCECNSEVLNVSVDKEDKQVFLSIYTCGVYKNNRISFLFRLKQVWKILKTGTPFSDCIIFNFETARKLSQFLDKSVKEIRGNE